MTASLKLYPPRIFAKISAQILFLPSSTLHSGAVHVSKEGGSMQKRGFQFFKSFETPLSGGGGGGAFWRKSGVARSFWIIYYSPKGTAKARRSSGIAASVVFFILGFFFHTTGRPFFLPAAPFFLPGKVMYGDGIWPIRQRWGDVPSPSSFFCCGKREFFLRSPLPQTLSSSSLLWDAVWSGGASVNRF